MADGASTAQSSAAAQTLAQQLGEPTWGDWDSVAADLEELRTCLLSAEGALVNLTADEKSPRRGRAARVRVPRLTPLPPARRRARTSPSCSYRAAAR